METRILDFSSRLRKLGLRISPSEDIDAMSALTNIGFDDREVFRAALKTCLVKKADDEPTFDRLFDEYFSGVLPFTADKGSAGGDELREKLEEIFTAHPELFSDFFKELMLKDAAALMRRVSATAKNVNIETISFFTQVGFYSQRLLSQFPQDALAAELSRLTTMLAEGGQGGGAGAKAQQRFEETLQDFQKGVRDFVAHEAKRGEIGYLNDMQSRTIGAKNFYQLTDAEVAAAREVVGRFARHLRDRISLRREPQKEGALDVKATLRANMRYGGVPLKVVFREKKKKKEDIVVLCDVSRSVQYVSRFLLTILYALQREFIRVKSFIFISELDEVTRFFTEHQVNEALELALSRAKINFFSYSDYGSVFVDFVNRYINYVHSKTTVLIIGDGRSNYLPPELWALRRIKERARRIIWLNPETRSGWRIGDCIMFAYEPLLDVAEECHNLDQLMAIIEKLRLYTYV